MTREEALTNLGSPNARIRLTAARHFERTSTDQDLTALTAAMRTETVTYVRSALARAIKRAQPQPAPPSLDAGQIDDAEDALAAAIVQVTAEFLHELEPLVGVLRLRMRSEWSDFESSQSKLAVDHIEGFLTALGDLNAAARVPAVEDISVKETLQQVIDETAQDLSGRIALSGPDLHVRSNRSLLHLIVRNGLRNAIEATTLEDRQIVVAWGPAAENGFFVSVMDNGPGPPAGAELHAFDVGSSTKRGHLGMGLAIARRAAESLGGTLTLRHGKVGGAVVRFRGEQTR